MRTLVLVSSKANRQPHALCDYHNLACALARFGLLRFLWFLTHKTDLLICLRVPIVLAVCLERIMSTLLVIEGSVAYTPPQRALERPVVSARQICYLLRRSFGNARLRKPNLAPEASSSKRRPSDSINRRTVRLSPMS